MKKLGFDIHSIFGAGGFAATVTLATVNEAIASLVGLATLAYMTFRAMREWRKWDNEKTKTKE